MKKILLFCLPLLLFYSCSKNPNAFVVDATLLDIKDDALCKVGDTILLYQYKEKAIKPVDSAIVAKDGSFHLKGETDKPNFFSIGMPNSPQIYLIVHARDHIKLKIDAENFEKKYDISGSEDSKLLKELNDHLVFTRHKLDSLGFAARNARVKNDSLRTEITSKYMKITDAERKFTLDFIEKHLNSLACFMALTRPVERDLDLIKMPADIKYYKMVDSALSVKYPDHEQIKLLHRFVSESELQMKQAQMQHKTIDVGMQAPEVKLKNPEGKEISLSSFKGKYVLLDFWASWCGPCRSENPNLVAIHKKYQAKGFEIFQVSLDKTKDDWIKAIKTDNLTWSHGSDLKWWESEPAKIYGVTAIPSNYLIDKQGKVIGVNLKGEVLEKKLAEVLK